jgi:hypothetical protein
VEHQGSADQHKGRHPECTHPKAHGKHLNPIEAPQSAAAMHEAGAGSARREEPGWHKGKAEQAASKVTANEP